MFHVPDGMLMGDRTGRFIQRVFNPPRWRLDRWAWWWCAVHWPGVWRVLKRPRPETGVSEVVLGGGAHIRLRFVLLRDRVR